MTVIPSTVADWRALMDKAGFSYDDSIHDFEAARSGSRTTHAQFLLLRTLRELHHTDEELTARDQAFARFVDRRFLDEAKALLGLDDNKEFKWYLDHLPPESATLANDRLNNFYSGKENRWAQVARRQLLINDISTTSTKDAPSIVPLPDLVRRMRDDEASDFLGEDRSTTTLGPSLPFRGRPPISNAELEALLDRDQIRYPRTPSPRRRADIRYEITPATDVQSDDPRDETYEDSPTKQKLRDMTANMDEGMFLITPDEQVVNASCINTLDQLLAEADGRMPVIVQDKRHRFRFHNQFVAITDGTLTLGKGPDSIRALIEVKPFPRNEEHDARTCRQEVAEMASWNSQEEDGYSASLQEACEDKSKKWRALLSENRSDLYISIFEFSDAYLDYVRDAVPEAEDRRAMDAASGLEVGPQEDDFMIMHQFGPYSIHDKEDFKEFARNFVALALYWRDEAPSRGR